MTHRAPVRLTVAALALGLMAVILLTGCAPGSSPTAPTALGSGSTFSEADTFGTLADRRLVDVVPHGRSCPSEAPSLLVAGNSLGHLDVEWGQNPAAGQIAVQIDRYEVTNAFAPFRTVRETTTKGRAEVKAGPGVYRVTARYELACGLSNATVRQVSIGPWPDRAPVMACQDYDSFGACEE